MYTEAFKSFSDQTEKTITPFIKFNRLVAKNIEQLTDFQLNSVRTYSDLCISQIKAAAEIKDPTSLASFNSNQLATFAKISEQISEDSKKLQDIAQEFRDEFDNLVSEQTNETAEE